MNAHANDPIDLPASTLFYQAKSYHDGINVPVDLNRAKILYEQAAEKGSKDAMVNLGYLYFVGEGVSQDYTQARDWYEKAFALGDKAAELNLNYMKQNGLGIKPKLKTPTPAAAPTVKSATKLFTAPRPVNLPTPTPIVRQEPVSTELVTRDYTELTLLDTKPLSAQSFSVANVLAAILLFTFVVVSILIAILDRLDKRRQESSNTLGVAFFENNRRVLREIYLRFPHAMRDSHNRESPLSVAISVLLVRFALLERHYPDTALPKNAKAKCDKILGPLKTCPARSRHIAHESLDSITELIRSDIRAFDIETTTRAETPPLYRNSSRAKQTHASSKGASLSLVS